MAHLLTLYSQSKQSDLQQRCLEFLQLAREGPAAMAAVLPVDASCEDVEVCVHVVGYACVRACGFDACALRPKIDSRWREQMLGNRR